MTIGRVIVWAGRLAEIAVLCLLAAAVAGYAWLHSRAGMDWLAGTIEKATSGQVSPTGLSGMLPFWLEAESVVARDTDDTPWLKVSGLEVGLAWRPLLHRTVQLSRLTADDVQWVVMPRYRTTPRDDPGMRPDPRPFPLRFIELPHVRIAHFVIEPEIIGHAISGDLQGKARWIIHGRLDAQASGGTVIDLVPPVQWQLDFAMEDGALLVPSLTVRQQDDVLALSGEYTPESQELRATATLSAAEIARYRALHRLDLAGAGRAELEMTHQGRGQPWRFDARLNMASVRYGPFEGAGLTATGRLDLAGDGLSYQLDASANRLWTGEWRLDHTMLTGRGLRQQHKASIQTAGAFSGEHLFSAEAAASFDWRSPAEGWTATLSSFSGEWNGLRVAAGEPLAWTASNQTMILSAPTVLLEDALLRGHMRIEEGSLDAFDLALYPVNLARISEWLGEQAPDFEGEASLFVTAEHLRHAPAARGTLTATHVLADYSLLGHFAHASVTLEAELLPDRLRVQGNVEHPLLHQFEMSAAVSLESADGFFPLWPAWALGIDANITMAGDLRDMSETLVNSPTAWSGQVEMELSACNLPHHPDIDGYVTWRNGQYRNLATGTFADQIEVTLRGDRATLRIEEARARDGGRGSITATGEARFAAGWQPDWEFALALNRATLFRVIQTELPLTGAIAFTGSVAGARASGELWLEPFRFTIPRRLPPAIRELEVIEINHPDPARNTPVNGRPVDAAPPERQGADIELDISVRTRQGFEVTGRGLQSEWRGSMRLTGTTRQPQLTGGMQVFRGHAMLLGRRFHFDEGRIELLGSVPPRPQLNISISTRIAEVVARLDVRGPADQPDIQLSSDPLLPEDEIMAMILFGKSVETMTPWQAIALANGLRILSGGGGDVVNIIDSSQNVLQVDQIDLRQDQEGEGFSSVAVGKHFGRRLYVEGEKGLGNAEDTINITIELTPRLILETEASPGIREGISLYWRKDL